jgi:hypothetical protein
MGILTGIKSAQHRPTGRQGGYMHKIFKRAACTVLSESSGTKDLQPAMAGAHAPTHFNMQHWEHFL